MSKLVQVRERCILLWPASFPGDDVRRGGPGYVVDLDAPCEIEFVAGQEHKLAPAPKDATPNAINHPRAARMVVAEQKRLAELAPAKPAKPAQPPGDSGAGSGSSTTADATPQPPQTTATAAPAAKAEDDLEVKRPRAAKAGAA